MILFPAIDILNGKCVRLTQGNYQKEKIYHEHPIEVAKEWEKKGATFIHIVDLDGAKTGQSLNQEVITHIAQTISIPIQAGGGMRSFETIEAYLSAGISRVIIGTAAIHDKAFLKQAVQQFKAKIAVSIDARNGYVATDGWTMNSTVKATDLIKDLEKLGVQTIVYTDILKDGMLQGPNLAELKAINQTTHTQAIASGGVTTKADVNNLRELKLYGAIIGKALYDGNLDFTQLQEGEENDNETNHRLP